MNNEEKGLGAATGRTLDDWFASASWQQKTKVFGILFLLITGGVGEYLGVGPRAFMAWLNRPAFAENERRLVAIQAALGTVAQNQVILSDNQQELNGAVSELHGYSEAIRRYNLKRDQERARPHPLTPVPDLSESRSGYIPTFPNVHP